MFAKNSLPIFCIAIQVSAVGVGRYSLPNFFDVFVPVKLSEPQPAPILIPAAAENPAKVVPLDSPVPSPAEEPAPVNPLPFPFPISAPNLTSPPEVIPPDLDNSPVTNIIDEITKNPNRGIAALAEDLSTRLRDRLFGQGLTLNQRPGNPADFAFIIDNLQKAIDSFGQNKGCESGLNVVDHAIFTTKALINSLSAMQKLREMWSGTNINNFVECFITPIWTPPKMNLGPTDGQTSN